MVRKMEMWRVEFRKLVAILPAMCSFQRAARALRAVADNLLISDEKFTRGVTIPHIVRDVSGLQAVRADLFSWLAIYSDMLNVGSVDSEFNAFFARMDALIEVNELARFWNTEPTTSLRRQLVAEIQFQLGEVYKDPFDTGYLAQVNDVPVATEVPF